LILQSLIGGGQEEQTAIGAIRAAAGKEAVISSVASDDYPIMVTIRSGDGKVLWKASQKKLYRKYPFDREKSIEQIQDAVRQYLIDSR
jgi:hypothetical protein